MGKELEVNRSGSEAIALHLKRHVTQLQESNEALSDEVSSLKSQVRPAIQECTITSLS